MRDWQDDGAPDVRVLNKRTGGRARKLHECSLCKGPIEIGERYDMIAHLVDGRFEVFRSHPHGCPKWWNETMAEAQAPRP